MQLSIVMPAHNEADHIEQCVAEWHDRVVSPIGEAELIVVDDCSTDGTGARLESLTGRYPGLRVLRTPGNAGHGGAVRFGLDRCRGDFVFQTDSDRQHTPADFDALWRRRHEADFVFGVRSTRADGRFRMVISGTMRVINFLLWGHWIADANCPFKLMRRGPMHRVLGLVPAHSFIPMVMVSVLARRGGFRVREVEVSHRPRTAGQQSLAGLARWARVSSRCARELVALRLATRRRGRFTRDIPAGIPGTVKAD
jgi:glycosyltransferase involved in cell wall biosynthesis